MIFKEKLTNPYGQLFLRIFKIGELYQTVHLKNTVMNSGKSLLSNLFVGNNVSNKKISQIGIGDSNVANDVSMLGLQGSFLYQKNISSFVLPAYNQIQINFSFGADEGNGINVKEYGLFSADGNIFNRVVWTGSNFVKTIDFELQGYFLITF